MKRAALFFATVTMVTAGGWAFAEPQQYKVCMRVYRALTNISGETSCTQESSKGVWHKCTLMLNDVKLEVDGQKLLWTLPDGKQTEDLAHPLIQALSAPSLVSMAGEPASVCIGEETPAGVQYFEARKDGFYALKKTDAEFLGLRYTCTIKPEDKDNVVRLDFSFDNSWVEEREKLDGVYLEVGKPKVAHEKAEGYLKAVLGEWCAYQIAIPSRGTIFIFFKITPWQPSEK
jgi:hypothetical protein